MSYYDFDIPAEAEEWAPVMQKVHETAKDIIRVGDIIIDSSRYAVTVNGKEQGFKKMDFELLRFMARSAGTLVTREVLIKHLWGDAVIVASRTIDVHMFNIRKRIGHDRITCIKGVGFRFELLTNDIKQ